MPLSSAITRDNIEPDYDVVVIGSGYGAAIAASRLARALPRRTVCVLERGREIAVGEFPEQPGAASREVQIDSGFGSEGSPLGLYDFRFNKEMSVLVGCGLGGTSLINAGVALRPDPHVFGKDRWPAALAADVDGLAEGYRRAEAMLQPNVYPDGARPLAKLEAHRKSAEALGDRYTFSKMPLDVHFEAGTSPAGVAQPACVLCGNCVAGCNTGAKNTLMMNYLPDAGAHGAQIFTRVEVRFVAPAGDDAPRDPRVKQKRRWAVHFVEVGAGPAPGPDAPTQFVLADYVVLGAGTLGSTEILLRSRPRLASSGQLGRRFTANGDKLSFSYDPTGAACNAIGWPLTDKPAAPADAVGPTITSGIAFTGARVDGDLLLQEGAIPSAIAGIATLSFAAVGKATELRRGVLREDRPVEAAAHASQTYLLMAFDDDGGVISLDEKRDRPRISWPGVGNAPEPPLPGAAAAGIGGTYLPDPIWHSFFGNRLITVHPLGGCAMGDDGTRGVVNDRCQVFDGPGTTVHPGLYVCDGSVIPTPLAVNPLLTISALAERAMTLLARDEGWTFDDASIDGGAAPAPADGPPPPVGVQFQEELSGFVTVGAPDFEQGFADGQAGKPGGSILDMQLTIDSDDVRALVDTPAHEARVSGTVTAPALSPEPLTVTHGVFNLLYEDAAEPGLRLMRYRMRLTSVADESFWFDGKKYIGNDSPLDALRDSSTLYVTIYRGTAAVEPALARGRARIDVANIVKLLESLRITDTRHWWEQIPATTKFLGYFFGAEIKTYLSDVRSWVHPHDPPDRI